MRISPRRSIAGLFALISVLGFAACSEAPPSSGASSSTSSTGAGGSGGGQLEGRQVLDIDIVAEHENSGTLGDCPTDGKVGMTWSLVADLTREGASVTGWLAMTGQQSAQGEPVEETNGSVAVQGTVSGSTVSLLGAAVYPLEFDAFDLVWEEGGAIGGTARGIWTFRENDYQCTLPFQAVIRGGPDTSAPKAVIPGAMGRPTLPFEPIEVTLNEPVVAEGIGAIASGAAGALPVSVSPVLDYREGFARKLMLVPDPAWPVGETLSLSLSSLVDAAGNGGDLSLGEVSIPTPPASNGNLGFEESLDGWLSDPLPPKEPWVIGAVYTPSKVEGEDSAGTPYSIVPVEGTRMAQLFTGGRLIGFLKPPAGATRLIVPIGFVDSFPTELQEQKEGVRIQLVIDGKLTVVADGSDLPAITDPDAVWTGFGDVSIDLPASEAEGFWIVIEPSGFAPPIHVPEVLVDALSFE